MIYMKTNKKIENWSKNHSINSTIHYPTLDEEIIILIKKNNEDIRI